MTQYLVSVSGPPLLTWPHFSSHWCYRFPLGLLYLHCGGLHDGLIVSTSLPIPSTLGLQEFLHLIPATHKPRVRQESQISGHPFYLSNYAVLPGLLWCDLLLINRLILLSYRGSQDKRPHCSQFFLTSQESVQSCSHCMLFHLILVYCILSYLISPLLISSFSNFSHTSRNRKRSSLVLSLQVVFLFYQRKAWFMPRGERDVFSKLWARQIL